MPGSRLGGALAALLGLPIGNGGTVSYYTEHRYIVQLDTADSSTIYRAVTCLDLMASCSIGREAREPANFWYFLDVRHFASLKHNGQIEILATHYCSCAAAFLSPPLSLPLSPSLYSFFLSLSSFPPPFSLLLSPPLPPQSDATNAGRLLVGCLVLLSASVNFSLHAFSTKIMNAVIAAVRAEWSTRSPFAAVVAAAASRSALHSAVRMLIFLHHSLLLCVFLSCFVFLGLCFVFLFFVFRRSSSILSRPPPFFPDILAHFLLVLLPISCRGPGRTGRKRHTSSREEDVVTHMRPCGAQQRVGLT